KGILLGNVDLEEIKGKDLMVTMAGAMHQQINLHHMHWWLKMVYEDMTENYDSKREKHSRARLEIQGYELALESLESMILVHEKNELACGEKYEFQNYELKCKEIKISNLNLELEKVVKERDELKLKIEKWEESSKNLDELLNNQMSARDKTGLGYVCRKRISHKGRKTKPRTTKLSTEWKCVKRRSKIKAKESIKLDSQPRQGQSQLRETEAENTI
ncbi:hypothetical protein Tco_1565955, partial [Tanacetum coccineum]